MDSKPAPSWWGRHWKWLVPAGCLTGLAAVAGFIALIVGLVFGLLKSTTPYKEALAKAQRDPVVISRLGTPIQGASSSPAMSASPAARGKPSWPFPCRAPGAAAPSTWRPARAPAPGPTPP